MKIAGIIAEYNPFHNGHAHHIAETRRITGCDYVVVCMDGSFTQRGEAACLDKWTRARAALSCGADAVFELPALWAVNTADAFARGGTAVLDGIGCDVLSFGSETADALLISALAELRENEPAGVSRAVQFKLSEGKSHARARGEALAEHLQLDPELLNSPNLTLGVEYLRALRAMGSAMEICPVARIGGYHDTALGEFASASAIRAALARGDRSAFEGVPAVTAAALAEAGSLHAPDDLVLHVLRGMDEARAAALPGVNEGLEKRLLRCAAEASGYEELLDLLKCKRYTRARLARLCTHAMLGMTRDLVQRHPLPAYARLIGMRADARGLMSELKARARLPILSDAAALRSDEVFRLECRATDLRALMCACPGERRAGSEFTRKFVRV